MIRKLFWLVLFVGGYFYVISGDDSNEVPEKVATVCKLVKQKWSDMDLRYHVHSLECFKKNQKRKR